MDIGQPMSRVVDRVIGLLEKREAAEVIPCARLWLVGAKGRGPFTAHAKCRHFPGRWRDDTTFFGVESPTLDFLGNGREWQRLAGVNRPFGVTTREQGQRECEISHSHVWEVN